MGGMDKVEITRFVSEDKRIELTAGSHKDHIFISSDRSSYSDDVLLHIHPGHFFGFSLSPLMQLMLQMSI